MEERSPFRRSRNLSLQRVPLRPRFTNNERFSRSSNTSFRSQRYHTTEGHPRRHPIDAPGSYHHAGRERERKSLSTMISQERENASSRGLPSTVTRAAARNRAIQQKRREIEEVYKQDCDTMSIVVKMLVAKDPSLELLIQASLQENLREIGQRCVEAMECFIQDYDSQDSRTATSHLY